MSNKYALIPRAQLVRVLLNPHLADEERRAAFHELASDTPEKRSEVLASLFKAVLDDPETHRDMIDTTIELLATDPDPNATIAMLDILPHMADAGAHYEGSPIPEEVREYYYSALVTRRRDEDRRVWAEKIWEMDRRTLVDIVLDPAAEPLRQALDPFRIIEALPPLQRNRALLDVVINADRSAGWSALLQMVGAKKVKPRKQTGPLNDPDPPPD